ncbi:hypothetical protein NO1_0790 [Candidatus Termititenax aidoneus]|uniref:Uncharacterized protein n=1 Tax=Termititenax aidoneus TaxID=2218524 RepID=A0A388TB46_TERA1|nr:hypothetical protein NO1_0790 [Candidatus Termititenax aidoneus]
MYRKLHAHYDELGEIIHKLIDYPQTSAVLDSIDTLHNYRKRLAGRIFPGLPEKRLIARHIPPNIPAAATARPADQPADNVVNPHSQYFWHLPHLSLAAISFDFEQSLK